MKTYKGSARASVIRALSLAALIGGTGCSRQVAVPGSGNAAGSSQLPFERASDSSGISPTNELTSQEIPAGTEIIVRLRFALSSEGSRTGDSFQAVLDEPVMADGITVLPPGAAITGSVLAARASAGAGDTPGYMRLTLASIAVNGKSIPLQASSIFAKGGAYQKHRAATTKTSQSVQDSGQATGAPLNPSRGNVKFSTGRRLTFRLAQPLHL